MQEGRRVARGREGALFTVSPERLDDYPRELIAWRWKELSRFVVADARVFELTFHQGGEPMRRVKGVLRAGEWEMTPEPMDPQRARTLVRVLSALEAEEIVAEELGDAEREALGLSPGGLTVRVMGEGDVELAEVAFGVRQVDGGPLAVRSDRTVIYRIASEDGEALPADWSDFMRSFLAGKKKPHPRAVPA